MFHYVSGMGSSRGQIMVSRRSALAPHRNGPRVLDYSLPPFADVRGPWFLFTVSIAGISLLVFWLMCEMSEGQPFHLLAWHPTGPISKGDVIIVHDHGTVRMKNISPYTFTYEGWEHSPVYQSYTFDGTGWKKNRDGFCATNIDTRAFRPQQEIVVEMDSASQLLRAGQRRTRIGQQQYDVSVQATNGEVIVSAFDSGP
jgi:hypothetical protein